MLLTNLADRVAVQLLARLAAAGQVVPIMFLPFLFLYLKDLITNAYAYEEFWRDPPLGPQEDRSVEQ